MSLASSLYWIPKIYDEYNRMKYAIIVVCIIILVLSVPHDIKENMSMIEKKCICFLSVTPSKEFYDYCKTLKTDLYDVYICLDNMAYNIPGYDGEIPLIKIQNGEAEEAGFKGSVLWTADRACSRDKALYYFCKINTSYDYIWFIEDDVFIPCTNTIEILDKRYPEGDLLCESNDITHTKKSGWLWRDWLWDHIYNQMSLPLPHSKSKICAIRVSKSMIECIEAYATEHRSLFLDEVLFTTLAIHNELNIITPVELSTIQFKRSWSFDEIKKDHLYHPMKEFRIQETYRSKLLC